MTTTLPPLTPQTAIARRLSLSEYFHASAGKHPQTVESPNEGAIIFEALGTVPAERWRAAVAQVAEANPGLRLCVVGSNRNAHWRSDGPPPRLRTIADCRWDGRSEVGAEFIWAEPLSIDQGPCCELVIAPRGASSLAIFRTHHAAMDGRGLLHFAAETFRALRGEPLLGTNAGFSDVELLVAMGTWYSHARRARTRPLTGPIQGSEWGNAWRRVTFTGNRRDIMARVAVAMADYYHQHSAGPAVITVPVDLRRHVPGLHSTLNFASGLMVQLRRGEGLADFKRKLGHMLDRNMETAYYRVLEALHWLPMAQLDRLMRRTAKNRLTKPPLETCLISNIGMLDAAEFSCAGFQLQAVYAPPHTRNAGCIMAGVGGRVEIVIGMPLVQASNGRLDAFLRFLERALDDRAEHRAGPR